MNMCITRFGILVYDLEFVGPFEFKLVAPMPEQLKTSTIHFYEASRKPYQNLPAEKLGENFPLFFVQGALKNMNFGLIFAHFKHAILKNIDLAYFTLILANFNVCLLHDTSGKCIVVDPICSGMGATKSKFWVLRS